MKEQIRIRELLINCRYHVEKSEYHDNDNHFYEIVKLLFFSFFNLNVFKN